MISFKGFYTCNKLITQFRHYFKHKKRHKRAHTYREENGLRSSLIVNETCSQVSLQRVKESLFILFRSRDTVWIVRQRFFAVVSLSLLRQDHPTQDLQLEPLSFSQGVHHRPRASYRRVYHSVRSARAHYQENQKVEMTTSAFNATVVYIQDSQSPAEKRLALNMMINMLSQNTDKSGKTLLDQMYILLLKFF